MTNEKFEYAKKKTIAKWRTLLDLNIQNKKVELPADCGFCGEYGGLFLFPQYCYNCPILKGLKQPCYQHRIIGDICNDSNVAIKPENLTKVLALLCYLHSFELPEVPDAKKDR